MDKNIDEVAMDEDSDQEEDKHKAHKHGGKKDLPLPPNPEHVIIRKDYDPKSKQQTSGSKATGDTYFKSPLTGELIPASSMSEHMRISMLDPRWIEQRQKEKKEREEQEEVLASGFSIEKNLKRLAEYRSDVFGSGADEVIIGKKVGEEEERNKEDAATIWDGHTNSVEKTAKRAMTGITVEDQIRAIHQSQGIADEDNNKMGQSSSSIKMVSNIVQPIIKPPQPATQQQLLLSSYKMMSSVPMQVRPPPMPPSMPMMMEQPPPPLLRQEIAMPMEESPAKRLKTEEQLIPEAEYLEQHGFKGPVHFSVQIPHVPDKPEWNLNGQLIPFTMPLTETV